MKSYLERLDRLPPFACLLIARHKDGQPISIKEIAAKLGVSIYAVRKVLTLTSWATVPVQVADTYRAACGVTPKTERLQVAYLKRTMSLPSGLRHVKHMRPQTRLMLMRLSSTKSASS